MEKKLEVVISTEHSNRTVGTLKEVFPTLKQEARSSFFIIMGCYTSDFGLESKEWLDALVLRGIVVRYRCKEREDR